MTSRQTPQCLYCARFQSPLDGAPEQTCTAFPDGIPDDIWSNEVDHRQPHEGDHGLRWKPDGDDTEFPDWVLTT